MIIEDQQNKKKKKKRKKTCIESIKLATKLLIDPKTALPVKICQNENRGVVETEKKYPTQCLFLEIYCANFFIV